MFAIAIWIILFVLILVAFLTNFVALLLLAVIVYATLVFLNAKQVIQDHDAFTRRSKREEEIRVEDIQEDFSQKGAIGSKMDEIVENARNDFKDKRDEANRKFAYDLIKTLVPFPDVLKKLN